MKRTYKKVMITAVTLLVFFTSLAGCAGCAGRKGETIQPTMISIATIVPIKSENTLTEKVTPTEIPIKTPTEVSTATEIPTSTSIPTEVPTGEPEPTAIPESTVILAPAPTNTPIPSPMVTPTVTPVAVPTATPIPIVTLKPTATPKPTATLTPTPTSTVVPVKGIAIGDYVTFGSYEQDNNLTNGQEPIEWLVLDVKDGKAFLLAKYGLDRHRYHTEKFIDDDIKKPIKVTWETCEMRSWLNSTFMNTAFTVEEQQSIVLTMVTNPDSKQGTDGGNDTMDKVYLMSGEESRKYLGQEVYVDATVGYRNDKAHTTPTAYAREQGVEAWKHNRWYDGNCEWWLRTPGKGTNWAGIISFDGGYNTGGYYVTGGLAVRPVVWIDVTTADVEKVN